jgi:hypothetical protein
MKVLKRIQSLDILRGVAMLGLVFLHAFEQLGINEIKGIFDLPIYIFLPVAIILYLGAWRGFFLIISGASNAFGFYNSLKSGKDPNKLLVVRIAWGIVLFGHGVIIQIFWNPYQMRELFSGNFEAFMKFNGLLWSDAVEIIGLCLIFTSLLQYLLFFIKHKQKMWISIGIILGLAIGIFIITPFIGEYFLTKYGWDSLLKTKTFGGFRSFLLGLFIGEQEPLFPYLGTFLLGNAIGIVLHHPKVNKKNVQMVGYITGGIFIVAGVLVGGIRDNFKFEFVGALFTDWFLNIATGLQLWLITAFLYGFDFNDKAQSRIKHTKNLRRAGILAITIFTLQSLDLFPRWILSLIFKPLGIDFLFGSLSMGYCFLASFVVLWYWYMIVWLWSKINFIGSFDWLFIMFRQWISGLKVNWRDPINSREIIFNPELIFVKDPNEIEEEDSRIIS